LRRIRVFKTESFRLATVFATLFAGFALALLGAVYWIVNDTQTSTLLGAVDADIRTIINGYRDEGISEAIEVVRQRLGSRDYAGQDLPGGYILIRDRTHGTLAGNLSSLEPELGLLRFSLPRPPPQPPITVLGRGVYIADGVYLFVGRDTGPIAATRMRLLQAFAWLAGASIVFAGLGGIFFSVRFMRRIDAIATTCRAIVAGRFNDRIPLRGSGDELDRLAAAINDMLERIAALLENLRQVSSDVAHDLRTPLTHLRTRLEDARLRSVTTKDYAAAVSNAIGDTDRLLAIFTALLRISQIESGTRMAAFSTLSLTDLLERLHEMYRPVAEDQRLVLRCDIQKDVWIRGDSELLTQMFSNLIENAIRHTAPLTNILIGLGASNGTAVASIADDGPGIPAEEREKVFRRFYRLASSRSTPGNGLGLALVAAIANLHQARMGLSDNRPGLCFRASFSLHAGDTLDDVEAQAGEAV
jgi:signal transduction histidine kinase